MKLSGRSFLIFAAIVAVAAAAPRDVFEQQASGQLNEENRLQSWDAIRNWFRPATTYIRESLPDMTPSELASDVRDVAVDLRDRAKDHPVVQTVTNVVRPVGQWVSDTANTLSKTSFRDMYENVAQRVGNVDEQVADWINSRASNVPQAENIEILH